MPIYEYRCDVCGKLFEEIINKISPPDFSHCADASCDGVGKKLISSPGGFVTDNPAWLNDHTRAVLQKDGERPIETRKQHDDYLKANGYVQRC